MRFLAVLPAEPPLDPDSSQAQEWVLAELAKPEYADQRSLLERLLDWLAELLSGSTGVGGLPTWVLPGLLVLLTLLVVVGLARGMRRDPARGRARGSSDVLDEPHLDASDYRTRARVAVANGRAGDAATDFFRAIAATAVERFVLDDRPGRTAHELGVELGTAYPEHATALAAAADTFDRVRYGRAVISLDSARSVEELDRVLLGARAVLAGGVGSR